MGCAPRINAEFHKTMTILLAATAVLMVAVSSMEKLLKYLFQSDVVPFCPFKALFLQLLIPAGLLALIGGFYCVYVIVS